MPCQIEEAHIPAGLVELRRHTPLCCLILKKSHHMVMMLQTSDFGVLRS